MISEKIVIIDDDQRVHQSLKMILSEYEIISFSDADKGLEYLLAPNEIKLVLLDICMKEKNGIELLEQLRKVKKEIAVMLITAHGSQDIVIEALRKGANDYVEKPFDIHELRERIRSILKIKSNFDINLRDPKNKIRRIREFIKRNYTNASLEFIAKEMCLSPQYVGRLFTKNNGNGFRDYKLKIRMEKAMDLLRHSALDIGQIAYQLGYQNPESFMRAFKRFTQKTPSNFRQHPEVKI